MRASSPLINYFHLFFSVLADGLSENFEEVSVSVVDCPDLTEKPFMLASRGMQIF